MTQLWHSCRVFCGNGLSAHWLPDPPAEYSCVGIATRQMTSLCSAEPSPNRNRLLSSIMLWEENRRLRPKLWHQETQNGPQPPRTTMMFHVTSKLSLSVLKHVTKCRNKQRNNSGVFTSIWPLTLVNGAYDIRVILGQWLCSRRVPGWGQYRQTVLIQSDPKVTIPINPLLQKISPLCKW
jgi:hypothetical protein